MIFFDAPEPTDVPGWWVAPALYTDSYRNHQCHHKLPLGKGGALRKCKNTARFYEVIDHASNKPKPDGDAFCLQHFRKHVPAPTKEN